LFVGNSFTAANGMTSMITRLATDAPGSTCPVLAVQYTPGGSTLADAFNDRGVRHLISSERWNAVVLQDQSQLPSLPDWRASEMLPAVGKLDVLIRADGALPMLFETWGYRDGDAMNFPDGDTSVGVEAPRPSSERSVVDGHRTAEKGQGSSGLEDAELEGSATWTRLRPLPLAW
jgi:hypothetical protein